MVMREMSRCMSKKTVKALEIFNERMDERYGNVISADINGGYTGYVGKVIVEKMARICIDYEVLEVRISSGDTITLTVMNNGNCDGYVGWLSDSRGEPIDNDIYEVEIEDIGECRIVKSLTRIEFTGRIHF